jgi:uncharacterized protein with FMN-binding domain
VESESNNRNRQIIAALIVLVIIAVVVVGVSMGKKEDVSETPAGSTQSTSSTAESSEITATDFKDGTYTATGGYNSPGGAQKIGLTVTIKDNVITETSAENLATDAEAEEHQDDFIAGYKDEVVGKKINEITLDRVAGSSLTPIGFNNALEQIADEAKI